MRRVAFLACLVALVFAAAAGCASQPAKPSAEKPAARYAAFAMWSPVSGEARLMVADIRSRSVVASAVLWGVRAFSTVGTSAGAPAVLVATCDGFREIDLRTMRETRLTNADQHQEPLGAAYAADGAKLLWDKVPDSPEFVVHRMTVSGDQTASIRFGWPQQVKDPKTAWDLTMVALASDSPEQATFMQQALVRGDPYTLTPVRLWRADFRTGTGAQSGSELPSAPLLWEVGRGAELVRRWGVPSDAGTATTVLMSPDGARKTVPRLEYGIKLEPGGERYLRTRTTYKPGESGAGTVTVLAGRVGSTRHTQLAAFPVGSTGPLIHPIGRVEGDLAYLWTDVGNGVVRWPQPFSELRLRQIATGRESTIATWTVGLQGGVLPLYLGSYR